MAETKLTEVRQSCVAGFVKGGKSNKDKSVTFWVAKKRFVVAENSIFAPMLRHAKRALIRYDAGESKNPKINLVFINPSVKLIRDYMES
jgi:hypothetical protein